MLLLAKTKSLVKTGLIVIISLLIVLIISYLIFRYLDKQAVRSIVITAESDSLMTLAPVHLLYGIPVDSFQVEYDKVKRNQNLSHILNACGLTAKEIFTIDQHAQGVFDFRKIRYGNRYVSIFSSDSSRQLLYFIYEHTPLDYVLVNILDSLSVSMGKKDVIRKRKFTTSKIHASLWQTILDHNANPYLAIELSEIYAWTIDFFGIQPEDSFAVVYDELYVDTLSIGLGKIYAAYFIHAGRDFYAIPFVQDSVMSYFDEEGQSLRRAFLKAPLRYSRISSGFSHNRFHPILKIHRPHHGVDYAAPTGTPVHAIGDGKIIKKGYYNGAGHMVKIRHNSVYTTAYMHLSRYGKGIKTGVFVRQGDIIGYVGSTGLSTGPHLDFRFYKNGSAINPLKVEAPPVDPIKKENLEDFSKQREITLSLLQRKKTI